MVRCAQADGYCADGDPQPVAVAIVAMLNRFCSLPPVDIGYPAIYFREGVE